MFFLDSCPQNMGEITTKDEGNEGFLMVLGISSSQPGGSSPDGRKW